ncbi:acyltransferase family protein [Nocardioides sp. SYSU DS0663]|uniref:acyltransferase family protein n=1 Tax=Nocardioides sp. SYSU DS0663 TaxID=3416445 RepID=UPI003F4B080A
MSPAPPGRIEGIDLLRGVAVALVVLRHAAPGVFPGAGVVGVVMFFALSGHLITGLLLDEVARTGRIDLGRFYRRRARRLVPALLALVAGVVAVTLLLDPLGDRERLGDTVLVALTWTADLPLGDPSDATFHLWTLALEEQFYLVWPALLLLAAPRRRVGMLLLGATGACLLGCLATVVWLRADPDLAYALPTSWAVCFVIGAASRVHADRLVAAWGPPPGAVVAAAASLGVLAVVPLRGHALTYLAGGPAIAMLTTVVLLAWRTWASVDHPALRPLVLLGTVSYAAYLWNYPLTVWLRPYTDLAGPLAVVLTLVCAALSWRYVEAPLQQRRTPVGAGR